MMGGGLLFPTLGMAGGWTALLTPKLARPGLVIVAYHHIVTGYHPRPKLNAFFFKKKNRKIDIKAS